MRKPDYQKQEAKRSLWDCDGTHIRKRYRNKGRGRKADRLEIESALDEEATQAQLDEDDEWAKEIEEAWYCHLMGGCERCRAKSDEESK
jgi:hypothetical protein